MGEGPLVELDYNNLMADKVGRHGLSDADFERGRPVLTAALERLSAERAKGERPFLDMPRADLKPLLDFAKEREGRYDDLLLLGIGGSSLGAVALQGALGDPLHNLLSRVRRKGSPRFFVVDHTDPDHLSRVLRFLKAPRTLVMVVSKSGATAETLAAWIIVRDWLKSKVSDIRDHLVFITDPSKGYLRRLGSDLGVPLFPIPPALGGRFSVLSPVGLLPSAILGLDITELCRGAATMTEISLKPQLGLNPAAVRALAHHLLEKERGKTLNVFMPYVQSLRGVGDWFVQLWAESLGKRHNVTGQEVFHGQTPVRAIGVTDQHSQVQLFVEGPNDKVLSFVSVRRFSTRGKIADDTGGDPDVGYLSGATLQKLTECERLGTEVALTRAERPNCHLTLPRISPETVGALLQMLMVETALTGYLAGINPYDQPGVETGKRITFAKMGRTGYEAELEAIKPHLSRKSKYICG
ncbi:MAG: glucose-6-phosphate isomerase [Planctomycetota bacterium]